MFDFQISGNNEGNAGFGVKQRIKKLKSSNKKYILYQKIEFERKRIWKNLEMITLKEDILKI